MAIIKPKPKTAEDFIASAPDASFENETTKPKRVKKGKKVQITHTIKEEMLDEVDKLANVVGLSRAGLINIAIGQMLKRGNVTLNDLKLDDI